MITSAATSPGWACRAACSNLQRVACCACCGANGANCALPRPSRALVCAASLGAGWLLRLPETSVVPLAFASGLMALALSRNGLIRLLGTGPLLYLGEISYSTYLAHFLLFILFKQLFLDASLQMGWLGLAGFIAIVMAASVALYHMVEKPAQRWLNQHQPRRATLPKPATTA